MKKNVNELTGAKKNYKEKKYLIIEFIKASILSRGAVNNSR